MATINRYRNGVPSWADVAVTHVDGCVQFYTDLFGWEAEDQGEESNRYHMFRIGGRSVAGLGPKMADVAMPIWSAYVSVDDLDATLDAAAANGGTVVMPRHDISTSGSMAAVIDPTGAPISFWQPGEHIGAELVNEHNTLAWHELTTRDVDAAMGFYGTVLGWTFDQIPDGGGPGGYRMIMVGDRVVGGIMPMEGDEWGDMPSHWMIYFSVADTDATAARVTELGGVVSVPPFEAPVGKMAVVNDPDGNAFSIIAFSGEPETVDGGIA